MKKLINVLLILLISKISYSQNLNYYFGNIHAHSSYSDGNKDSLTSLMTTPLQDFLYAKNSEHIDFYGISEHNHSSAGMNNVQDFHKGFAYADSATVENSFIALYGMEWGVISGGGHVIIYGYDSLLGWDANDYDVFVAQNDYSSLWQKVNKKQGAFAYLAHPQNTDYSNLFTTTLNTSADSAIIGMAARSGPAFSTDTNYSDPSTGNFIPRYNDALKQGYHIGVGLDHDTHYSVFGRSNAGRLVLMAPALSRIEIYNALRKMRFYSSDDWNTEVSFKVNNEIMGSDITQIGTPTISVNINDSDLTDATSSISIYYGIPGSGTSPTILTTVNSSNSLSFTHSVLNNSTYYYYAKITQADGDIIWTSPIWYTRNDLTSLTVPVANFSINSNICQGQSLLPTNSSSNAPTSWNWTISGANNFSSSEQNPQFVLNNVGLNTIVLIVSNGAGTSSYSMQFNVNQYPLVSINIPDTTICLGETVNLIGSGAISYSWEPINVLNSGIGSNVIATPVITTPFILTGTSNGCSSTDTLLISVVNCAGVKEWTAETIKIYPNPSSGIIKIDLGSILGEKKIEVFDQKGEKIVSNITNGQIEEINLSLFESGIYNFLILVNGKSLIEKKITINKK